MRLPFRHPGNKICNCLSWLPEFRPWSEVTEEIRRFFFEWPIIAIFTVMPRLVAIGFSLLVEMEIDEEVSFMHLRVCVKPWIASSREWSDKTHLIPARIATRSVSGRPIFSLEGIARPAEKSDGIIGRFSDDNLHTIGSETMIGHHEW